MTKKQPVSNTIASHPKQQATITNTSDTIDKNINPSDFRFMRNGEILSELTDINILEPKQISCSKNKNIALLMLHGFSSSPAVYRHITPHLTGYDYIEIPCLPQHARNLLDFSNANFHAWLESTEQLYIKLKKDYKTVDVLGLSLGGLLAYHLSLKHELHQLILLAPALRLNQSNALLILTAQILKALGFFALRNQAGGLYQSEEGELTFRQLPIHAIYQILQLIKQTPLTPPQCSTQLLLGKHDNVVNSQKIEKAFSNHTHIQITWLENSGHVLPLDADKAQLIKIVNQL